MLPRVSESGIPQAMSSPGTDTPCAAASCGGRKRAPQGGIWAGGERPGGLGAWVGTQVLGPGCRRGGWVGVAWSVPGAVWVPVGQSPGWAAPLWPGSCDAAALEGCWRQPLSLYSAVPMGFPVIPPRTVVTQCRAHSRLVAASREKSGDLLCTRGRGPWWGPSPGQRWPPASGPSGALSGRQSSCFGAGP